MGNGEPSKLNKQQNGCSRHEVKQGYVRLDGGFSGVAVTNGLVLDINIPIKYELPTDEVECALQVLERNTVASMKESMKEESDWSQLKRLISKCGGSDDGIGGGSTSSKSVAKTVNSVLEDVVEFDEEAIKRIEKLKCRNVKYEQTIKELQKQIYGPNATEMEEVTARHRLPAKVEASTSQQCDPEVLRLQQELIARFEVLSLAEESEAQAFSRSQRSESRYQKLSSEYGQWQAGQQVEQEQHATARNRSMLALEEVREENSSLQNRLDELHENIERFENEDKVLVQQYEAEEYASAALDSEELYKCRLQVAYEEQSMVAINAHAEVLREEIAQITDQHYEEKVLREEIAQITEEYERSARDGSEFDGQAEHKFYLECEELRKEKALLQRDAMRLRKQLASKLAGIPKLCNNNSALAQEVVELEQALLCEQRAVEANRAIAIKDLDSKIEIVMSSKSRIESELQAVRTEVYAHPPFKEVRHFADESAACKVAAMQTLGRMHNSKRWH